MRVAVLSFAHLHAATYIRLLRDREGIELVTADPEAPPGDPTRGRALAEGLGADYVDTSPARTPATGTWSNGPPRTGHTSCARSPSQRRRRTPRP